MGTEPNIDRAAFESHEFERLLAQHRSAVRLHCYRMLGSLGDAEDMTQEALVRAWRARGALASRGAFRGWLYKIATNVCLTEIERRPRRALAPDLAEPSPGTEPVAPALAEPVWLDPLPGGWTDGIDPGPEARYSVHESVRLAFVALLQRLPPRQRGVLLLRDVLGLSAADVAAALDLSLDATNSLLARARATLRAAHGSDAPAAEPADPALLTRYIGAWLDGDVEALARLLREDVVVTMPPVPTWFRGREACMTFFRTRVFPRASPGWMRSTPVVASGQPGFARYLRCPETGVYRAHGIEVLSAAPDGIREVHAFLKPDLFVAFGLPAELPAG